MEDLNAIYKEIKFAISLQYQKHAGRKGNSEIPLFDEGYSYRKPTKIRLHKGWNDVLIKAPVGILKVKTGRIR